MPSLASVPAFIKNVIDHELLKSADKIEYIIEKGEEKTTSYNLKGVCDDYLLPGEDSGGEYSPSSPSLASSKYTSCPTNGGYREERIFSKSSALPVTMSKHTVEYMNESSPIDRDLPEMRSIDCSSEWNNWYNREVAPAMERNNIDDGRQWQEWSKREVSTTTPISPFEERTITYQREEGISLLNPEAAIKTGPGSQVIKHETFETETLEQTFNMSEPEVAEEPPKLIVLEPVRQILLEPKQPVKMPTDEDEQRMDDPNLMWMKMGPAQYGPPFGSLKRGKIREEEWVGPPCELCHKQIEERRCMLAENMKFHCWHFACSFCMKTLKVNDFLIAESDKKPYCLNCHKREFPGISLVNLNLDE